MKGFSPAIFRHLSADVYRKKSEVRCGFPSGQAVPTAESVGFIGKFAGNFDPATENVLCLHLTASSRSWCQAFG
ncbi:hypothetical protein B4135_0674 [Caldibacillus debilis]|uniref:Uncharacterized protein n=1 Tax=Caldibacillus debilis TaxID=301148 RepID=A0A150LKV8_9BACI|nr:hypothetical protein B4135_0674 [Caldibacillus debilis]